MSTKNSTLSSSSSWDYLRISSTPMARAWITQARFDVPEHRAHCDLGWPDLPLPLDLGPRRATLQRRKRNEGQVMGIGAGRTAV